MSGARIDQKEKELTLMIEPEKRELSLDLMGIAEGTDKSSLIGDYLRHYEAIFSPIREEKFNLIEIGVLHGASVRLWPKFFTNARIIGVDIDPACRSFEGGRVNIEIGSQADPEFLHQLACMYPPHIVVDDGSHRSDHIIFTFEHLFPAVAPGGYYVIEDLHFHLSEREAARLRGASPILASDYFAKLANDRMGGEQYVRSLQGFQRYTMEAIDSIQVIAQAAIIRKKAKAVLDTRKIDAVKAQIEKSNYWGNWLRLGQMLVAQGGELPQAVAAFRKAIDLNATAMPTYHRLSELLERMGDLDDAIDVLRTALDRAASTDELRVDVNRRIEKIMRLKPQK
jgi:hypothetical protein